MYQRVRYGFGGQGMGSGVKNLLIANGVAFVLQMMLGRPFELGFALNPANAVSHLYLWQFVSYMFLHGSFMHILFNMYALWMFGSEVERMWGTRSFYQYYFITGIGAGLLQGLVAPHATVIGASGAVMGVMMAFATLFPRREITMLLFFILPVTLQARVLVIGYAVISLFAGMSGASDGVAHFAHLGGLLIGWLYMKRGWDPEKILRKFRDWKRSRKMKVAQQDEEELERLRRMVDQVLDKANEVGMENLTRDEQTLLKKASKILKKSRD